MILATAHPSSIRQFQLVNERRREEGRRERGRTSSNSHIPRDQNPLIVQLNLPNRAHQPPNALPNESSVRTPLARWEIDDGYDYSGGVFSDFDICVSSSASSRGQGGRRAGEQEGNGPVSRSD